MSDSQTFRNTPATGHISRWFGYFLPLAGLIIFGLVVMRSRQLQEWHADPERSTAVPRMLAPRFELMDHHRHLVKLERFLGRQRVVLIFFDSELGADRDPRVRPLIDHFDQVQSAGVEVVAVGAATPFANKEAEQRLPKQTFPFPIVTDIDVANPIPLPAHRLWGAIDPKTEEPLPALFLIDRAGSVAVGPNGMPKRVVNEQQALQQLTAGKWPQMLSEATAEK